MNAHAFLEALAIVLGVAAVTTVLFQRLRQPVVLGYILAGLIVGPHVPIPLVADPQIIQTLSELGVILLMFSLGLEFSLGKLFRLGPTAGLTAVVQSCVMIWLGYLVGQLFGWSPLESFFAGAIIAISSTTIIAKAFDEQNVRGPLREMVVGVLIVEDLIAILLMAVLTAVASGQGLSASTMLVATGKLTLFLAGLVVVGLLLVPRGVRAVKKLGRPETTVVAAVGFCFAVSLLAHELGYSVALGAFIAGSLVAESGDHEEIEHLIQPVRDIFAAIFFVSVGIQIDPAVLAAYAPAIATLTFVVVFGKIAGVSVGAFLTGRSVRMSVQAGMSLAQIGEFSFIIAGLGISLGATGDFLYPVAVAVSAITTLTTPWLIKVSGPVADFVERKLPGRVQTFAALYGRWVDQLRSRPKDRTRGAALRHVVWLLLLDALLLVVLAVGTALAFVPMTGFVERAIGLPHDAARLTVIVAALLLALPLAAGVVRLARRLGLTIAEAALDPAPSERLDLAAAPRRAFVVTLQLGIVLLIGLPIVAVTQPLVGGLYVPVAFVVLLVGLGIAFWRGASDLHGHVQAGAQAIVEAVRAQARAGADDGPRPAGEAELARVRALLPGLGAFAPVRLDGASAALGRTLAEVNLRALTGASVLAILRGETGILMPSSEEVLREGDVLALIGAQEAIERARHHLSTGAGTG
jgi:CPA2 family monovalent cation:H+ antiporter-2